MDGDQPQPRRRGRPRRDAFIGPQNRPAIWGDQSLPRRQTRAQRERLQELANGNNPHYELGEDGRQRLWNGDRMRAQNHQQLANGNIPQLEIGDNDQAHVLNAGQAGQPEPEPQPEPKPEQEQEQEQKHPERGEGSNVDGKAVLSDSSDFTEGLAPEDGSGPAHPRTPTPPPTPPVRLSPSSPASHLNPLDYQDTPPPTPPVLSSPQLLHTSPQPAVVVNLSPGSIPPPQGLHVPPNDSGIDVRTPTPQPEQTPPQPELNPELNQNAWHHGNDQEEDDGLAGHEHGTPEPGMPGNASPPQQFLVPAGYVAGGWTGGFAAGEPQPGLQAVPVAGKLENGRDEEEWLHPNDVVEWQYPNEEEEEEQYPSEGREEQRSDAESEDAATPFGEEPSDNSSSSSSDGDATAAHDRGDMSDSLSAPSSSSSSSSSDDSDAAGEGLENDKERRDCPDPDDNGDQANDDEWHFNDSDEDLFGDGASSEGDRGKANVVLNQPYNENEQELRELPPLNNQPDEPAPAGQEPRSLSSLPDFDDEQWEADERELQRRNQRNYPLPWYGRGHAVQRYLRGDLTILPERLHGHDSVERNAIHWTRPSLDFGSHSRAPSLPSDWSSEEDWDYPEEEEEDGKSSKSSCTGSSTALKSGGSSDSDDELPPVAMPVNGTNVSSKGSSPGRSSPNQQRETPPSSPPPRLPPASCPSSPKRNRKEKAVPSPLKLAANSEETGVSSRDLELDMAARTARSNAPPPSAGHTMATTNTNLGHQPPTTPKKSSVRKHSLRRNSAGPFHQSEYPSTTVFREDFTFVPRNGRLSTPNSVSGNEGTYTMPDYTGQGDLDISPQTRNPPKVPQTGHAVPGTREARVQVGGKGFPQVHKDKGVEVVDPGDAECSSEEEEEEEEEEERRSPTRKSHRRPSGVHCPAFSTERYLQGQEQQREREQARQEEERGTYYQYNPRYDEGYTGGLTGSAVPAWMSAELDTLQPTSWISEASTESPLTKTSASSAKRSISSITDYDDDSDEASGSLAKRCRSSPSASPKRPRPFDEDDNEAYRPSKRLRMEQPALEKGEGQQGLGAMVVGIAGQQTDSVHREVQTRYDPEMIENEEYDPRTVGLPRIHGGQGSRSSASSVARTAQSWRGSTAYDPADERREEEYDPQHPRGQ